MTKVRVQKKLTKSSATAGDASAETAALWKLEDDWMTDRLAADVRSSQLILDDNYEGTTSFGLVQSKQDFIKTTQAASGAFVEHAQRDRSVQYSGTTAVSIGTATLSGDGRKHSYRYMRVFTRKDGQWRLVASLSTPLA